MLTLNSWLFGPDPLTTYSAAYSDMLGSIPRLMPSLIAILMPPTDGALSELQLIAVKRIRMMHNTGISFFTIFPLIGPL